MKILQIFGWVVLVHLAAFIAIFASPGCQSGPRNIPTPDATMPAGGTAATPVSFNIPAAQPVDLSTPAPAYNAPSPGHAAPTRPGSAAAVAITPAKPAAEVAPISTYTVARGDSLWTIAKKHNLSVTELAKANNLPAGVALQPGKKLIIPGKPGATPAVAAPAAGESRHLGTLTQQPKPVSGESVTHVVAPGESLGVIARKYQVTVGEIATANNLSGPTIRAGQKLVIPGFKAVSPKGTTTAAKQPAATETPATAPAATEPAPTTPAAPRFELKAPPAGQDLDAGLKDTSTEVPTIKVEEKSSTPPKN